MSLIITKEDLIAYAEVDYIIKHMNERYISKVPEKLKHFFETMKDPDTEVYVNPHLPLQKQNLQEYTLQILAILHVKYWCTSTERKNELISKMQKNQEKLEQQFYAKKDIQDAFASDDANVDRRVSTEDPVITKYSDYAENNSDIQDFTDTVEENNKVNENLIRTEDKKNSFISKMRNFFNKVFGKNSE